MKAAMTKITMKNLCCLLIIMLSLGACKKDALEVKQEKTYVQVKDVPPKTRWHCNHQSRW